MALTFLLLPVLLCLTDNTLFYLHTTIYIDFFSLSLFFESTFIFGGNFFSASDLRNFF
jgi:hypothetical protein